MIRAFVAICLFAGVLAQSRPQYCPDFRTVQDFDLHKFLGTWYLIATDEASTSACRRDEYFSNGTSVLIIRSGQDVKNQLNPNERLTVRPNPNGEPGLLRIIYPRGRDHYYMVLNTDYDNYAIIYECGSSRNNRGKTHILFRKFFITTSKREECNQAIARQDPTEGRELYRVEQKKCTNSLIW